MTSFPQKNNEPKKRRRTESALYEPIVKALCKKYAQYVHHFEITSNRTPSDTMKNVLQLSEVLYLGKFEKVFPDIMGYYITEVQKKPTEALPTLIPSIVVVEVKPRRIKVSDIYQIKKYAELFHAKDALLVSTEEMIIEVKKYLEHREDLLLFSRGETKIRIGRFNSQTNDFDPFWFPLTMFDPP